MILANSLIEGFLGSNLIGKSIVIIQLAGSVCMVAAIIGKLRALLSIETATRRFLRDFTAGMDVLDYYFTRRPTMTIGLEGIYKDTCERLLKLLPPEVRSQLARRQAIGPGVVSLTDSEVELVRGTCDHSLDEEELRIEKGMVIISTVVSLAPMLGLLGTVWGVLDAFADMGTAGSANLATIAPSISAALVTTVVGLIVAIAGVVAFNYMNNIIRKLSSDMEGFVEELTGRIACEFQRKGA